MGVDKYQILVAKGVSTDQVRSILNADPEYSNNFSIRKALAQEESNESHYLVVTLYGNEDAFLNTVERIAGYVYSRLLSMSEMLSPSSIPFSQACFINLIEFPIDIFINFEENRVLFHSVYMLLSSRFKSRHCIAMRGINSLSDNMYVFKSSISLPFSDPLPFSEDKLLDSDYSINFDSLVPISKYKKNESVKFQFKIYDKTKEVLEKQNCQIESITRFEITYFKPFSVCSFSDCKSLINGYLKLLATFSSEELEVLEDMLIAILYKEYIEEKNITKNLHFSAFVKKHSLFFFTQNIMKQVYLQVRASGLVKVEYRFYLRNWKKYNSSHKFYTLNDINQLMSMLRNNFDSFPF